MNKDEFNHLVETLDLKTASSNTIEKAITAFPYASSLHWFRSKVLSDSKHLNSNSAIRKAAVLSKDRSLFFDFIISETLSATVEKIEKEIEQPASTLPTTTNEAPKLDSPKPEVKDQSSKPPIAKKVEFSNTKEKEEQDQSVKEESKDKALKNVELEVKSKQETQELKENNISKEEEEFLKKELEKQIVSVAVSASISKEAEEPFVEEEKPAKQKTIESGKKTFSSWLKDLKEGESKKKHKFQKDLIDQFIQNDPQITPKKVNFFSPTQQAKLSLAEDEAFVTETLANIYAQQGNHQKAIKAYEMLMLKYPEKKVFFAARIKEIKKQLK